MTTEDKCCSIVPYFRVQPGKLEEFKELCLEFVEYSREEPKCLYYGFCFDGDEAHCREGYADAEGLLAHLKHVGPLLQAARELAEVIRLEIHGPESELEKLRAPGARQASCRLVTLLLAFCSLFPRPLC